jgi:hypothetical protein
MIVILSLLLFALEIAAIAIALLLVAGVLYVLGVIADWVRARQASRRVAAHIEMLTDEEIAELLASMDGRQP